MEESFLIGEAFVSSFLYNSASLKKNELLKEKVSLNEKLSSARAERKNWVEPLREWILDIKKSHAISLKQQFFPRTFVIVEYYYPLRELITKIKGSNVVGFACHISPK